MDTQEETGMDTQARKSLGRSFPRIEDAALLTGRGRFIDDLPVGPATAHAAILRSPHPHAAIEEIDIREALAIPGVFAVITGADLVPVTGTLVASVRVPAEARVMATDRVRYVGEPVAVAIAADRYIAEDALDAVRVRYRLLDPVVDPEAALAPGAPVLHEAVGGNLLNERHFSYGDPDAAFAAAARRITVVARYPRNTGAPMETYGVIATYDAHGDSYDVQANFQGPFSIHAVLARALNVPGNRLRLRMPPDSGGSFGVKQGVAPYVVLMAACARLTGRQVKWIEDRMEHLAASVSATNRVTRLDAAVDAEGRILALDWDQLEDCGAYLRAPEPATLYRMHGNMTGAYDIRNVRIRNRLVATNKTPTGLVRGFGGPQVYYPLERLMQRIAVELGLDPVEVTRRNLIPAGAFPYRTATGALYDSGDYRGAFDRALDAGGYASLLERRAAARAAGRLYGIGLAVVVEPSVSNMGYVSTVLTPEERRRAGPKNGAQASATVALDPLGGVSVHVASVPQGQGHRTVLAQVVADEFGLDPADIMVVTDLDTARDAWSIASGNYSSRFAPAVAGTAALAARRLRARLAAVAAGQLNVQVGEVRFAGGRIFAAGNPGNGVSFGRIAAAGHWAPGTIDPELGQTLRETVFWTPPELAAPSDADEVNSSLCHGFIFDFCGVEIERATGRVRIDRYVTMHDCGTILHPAMVDGQIRGGFAQGLGAALLEELAYGDDGAFISGTFADYMLPYATEVPPIEILHEETPSPFTPLGAKGVGEGNCMSTPVCIANAVADALGVAELHLPLTPSRLRALLGEAEPPPANRPAGPVAGEEPRAGARLLRGSGDTSVGAPPATIWAILLDPDELAALIPGAHGVRRVGADGFAAEVTLGVGPVRGRYSASIRLSGLDEPREATLSGTIEGALGGGSGSGRVRLLPEGAGGTRIEYEYEVRIGGRVAAAGDRLLAGASRVVIGAFFEALARRAGGAGARPGFWKRLLRMLGAGR
ncbi:molybdopterin cofactor-binding domain-containing protein [Acidiphilium sp.]|uniref:xanthine dehydrogenase family protein molybdopterin-binding subunit n=1 Tax=Acidiphilium sp. TaxID=527 RepID=UPI00258CEADD|nr:molybdopterin cofactor-binding domain-containing protein [Acidiphilium sp.]